jgi:ABC-2 type transport system permease protein/sodium transport system permease protein
MPLLVYPLLSLVLNRVLLTSVSGEPDTTVRIGVGSEIEGNALEQVLEIGYALLYDRNTAPVFVEEVIQDQKLPGSVQGGQTVLSMPVPQLIWMENNGREDLRRGAVDLVITRKSVANSLDNDSQTEMIDRGISRMLRQMANGANPSQPGELDSLAGVLGLYEVRYRQNDLRSERALQLLERILAAVNNITFNQLVGPSLETPFRLQATPVQMKSNYADLLATMVPLVLVLMTMAGAVYPAIDLTAGERERGTMEALIVSPMPSGALLFAKYSAVVTVALLTALANLAAMTITLWVSGIGKLVFGDGAFSVAVIGTILTLLVLFTMFFAALLLAVTSFAKSFKEAQAYLIPLMLLALTPGVMSLLPDVEFTGLLATVPLVNIVLLARQVLMGSAEWNTALVAVICNGIYALAALAVASRLFGSDASMQGSKGSWSDLLRRPREAQDFPTVDQMALTMAGMFPLYFVASSLLPSISQDVAVKLWISAVVSYALILGLPVLVAWYRGIRLIPTFRIHAGQALTWLPWIMGGILIGSTAWMVAHEIFIAGQALGIGTIRAEHLERVAEFRDALNKLPLWMVLFVFALTPAVCEEFLFRGFVLSSLHRYSATWAIVLSAMLFGLMHVLTSNVLAIERFLPSTFMGIILGWLALRTGSIFPGIIVHMLHNGLLLTASHYQKQLESWKILVEEGSHLPVAWLLAGAICLAIGIAIIWNGQRSLHSKSSPDSLSLH